MRKQYILLLCALAALISSFSGLRAAASAPPAPPRPLLPSPLRSPRIVIAKQQRKLFLYSRGRLLRVYSIGLGLNPVRDKLREGDRCTPEGQFYITGKNRASHFVKSLALSYPNRAAAERGLATHLITRQQYRTILHRLRHHETPPQDTLLGGNIMIHGGGSSQDWTWGCVALDKGNIQELFRVIPTGTLVQIKH